MLVGTVLFGIGLFFLPESVLGGAHIAAIGLSVFLSGLIATRWAADRWTLSPAAQRKWSLAFTVLAGALLVLFIVINWATFESGTAEGGSESGTLSLIAGT